jgi:hypothetical protein
VSVLSAAILFTGIAIEVCLVWRLLRGGLWREYAFLFFVVLFIVFRTFLFFAFLPTEYPALYWRTNAIDVALRFLVVWEVFRHVFPRGSALSTLLSRGFAVFAAMMVTFALGTFWSYWIYAESQSLWAALERSFGFAQAVMTLGILLAARMYGLPVGRPIRMIAMAFGAWASLATVNNAMIDLVRSFFPYWQVVRPLSFVVMLAAWTWAVWKDVPAPQPAVGEQPVRAEELSAWTEEWNRTLSSVRRVGPS